MPPKINFNTNHPWNKGDMVELIPVSFLNKIRNPSSTDYTDDLNGNIIHQDMVWENIKEIGMFEPLVIRVNVYSNEIRLESGNHRVKTPMKDNVLFLPCITFVTQVTIFAKGNGIHKFRLPKAFSRTKIIKCPYDFPIKLTEHLDISNAGSLAACNNHDNQT